MLRNYFDPALLPQIETYIEGLFAVEDDALRFAQSEAARAGMPAIQIRPTDGMLLHLLARAAGARRIVEIGTLAGYSGIWLARALPPDGRLYTLEANPLHAAVARRSFARAGLTDRVDVLEGPALDSLQRLDGGVRYDMVFIDADKDTYPAYLEWAVAHLRPGGVIAAHNALRNGGVVNPHNDGDYAMRRFNAMVARHPRLVSSVIAIGDGMLVAVLSSES